MKLNRNQKENMAATIMCTNQDLYIKPYYSKYKIYCANCGNQTIIDNQQLKEIRNSHTCPICWRPIKHIVKDKKSFHDYVSIKDDYDKHTYWGYSVSFEMVFDHAEHIHTDCVARFNGVEEMGNLVSSYMSTNVKDIHVAPFGNNICPDYEPTGKWKRKTQCRRYFELMYTYNQYSNDYKFNSVSKKEYLKAMVQDVPIKSTQLQIAKKHILSERQIKRMIIFNINKYEDVKRLNYNYGPWYDRNIYTENMMKASVNMNLNQYDQKYILENNILLNDYLDYLENCKLLGIKNKHPKNFLDANYKVSAKTEYLRDEKEREEAAPRIINLVKELPVMHTGKYSIDPIQDPYELKTDAEFMHNCIYSYLRKYSNRKCLLYIVRKQNKIVANVELRGDEIIQIRARYNKNPLKSVVKEVKQLVSQNGLALRSAMDKEEIDGKLFTL